MASLKELVSQQTGTAAEIASVLNTPSVERTHSTEVGYRGITIKYGAEFAATILAKIDAAGASNPLLKATYTAVCTTGIDFSAPVTQGMIDQLEADKLFTSDESAKLKAIGIYQISPCEANNLQAATEQSVQAALNEIATDIVKAEVDGAIDGVNQLYSLTPSTTREQAVMRFVLTLLPEKAKAIAKVLGG